MTSRPAAPVGHPDARPVVLVIAPPDRSVAAALEGAPYEVYPVHTGALAMACAPLLRPDVVIIDVNLPDMSGMEVCHWLCSNPRIGRHVPILITTSEAPTPEQRVSALRDGAWSFVVRPGDKDELLLKLEVYAQAKRNIDDAIAEMPVVVDAGLMLSRTGLARRARELGALMSRVKGPLACIVFEVDAAPADPRAEGIMGGASRVSDVIGALSPGEYAVLAPATDQTGALKLAQRVSTALRERMTDDPMFRARSVRAGYDVVTNLTYAPADPVALLARAATAVRDGQPEPDSPWVRRFDNNATMRPFDTPGVPPFRLGR